MTRARKLLLGLAVLLLLSQIPFAYRHRRLKQLDSTIQALNSSRTRHNPYTKYREYKGVVHVHSFLGGHTTGTFAEIVEAARENGLDFVVMTEHTEPQIDTAAATLEGKQDGILFVNGNEVNTANGDRVLAIPGDATLSNPKISVAEVKSHPGNGFTVAAYPSQFQDWKDVDGIEVYNVFTNSKLINPVVALFDTLWSHRSYPELMFANYYKRPDEALRIWDQNLASRRLIAIAGNDAHSNVGVQVTQNGQPVFKFQVDPYKTSFQLVRMHVLLSSDQTLEKTNLVAALKAGHSFIGFDLLGDTTNFRFEAVKSAEGTVAIMGDEVTLVPDLKLALLLPVPGRVVLLKNGQVLLDENKVTNLEIQVSEPGTYRVEVFQPQLGGPFAEQPWIISNPIFVKQLGK